MKHNEFTIEGRNAVIEAYRSGKTIDKLYVLDGCKDGPVMTILREAKKSGSIINYVDKERLDHMSETGHHQGVIANAAAYDYVEVSDILEAARSKGEDPFIFILDGIEDPQSRCNNKNRQSVRCAWSDHTETPCGRTYGNGCKNICGCA
mgnify:CR=1 FL=1